VRLACVLGLCVESLYSVREFVCLVCVFSLCVCLVCAFSVRVRVVF